MNARPLLSLLFHADKALDIVQAAFQMGLIAKLDAGPSTLRELAEATASIPLRLYKFLDAFESIGLVVREQPTDDLLSARYVSREPLAPAVEAVFGERSIERDRDKYPWREIHGRLEDVLTGRLDSQFPWPPRTESASVRSSSGLPVNRSESKDGWAPAKRDALLLPAWHERMAVALSPRGMII